MQNRICNTCGNSLPLSKFSKNKNLKLGREYKCKDCFKLYFQENKEKIDKNRKKYNLKYKQKHQKYFKKRYKRKKDQIRQLQKEYYENNKEKIREVQLKYFNKRYKEDPIFKLSQSVRKRTYDGLKGKYKSKRTEKLLGCSFKKLKQYIEQQFKPEMNWNNWGEIWELDHIIPITSFNLENKIEQEKCFNYTNLQPLFKTTKIAENLGYNEIGNRNKNNKL